MSSTYIWFCSLQTSQKYWCKLRKVARGTPLLQLREHEMVPYQFELIVIDLRLWLSVHRYQNHKNIKFHEQRVSNAFLESSNECSYFLLIDFQIVNYHYPWVVAHTGKIKYILFVVIKWCQTLSLKSNSFKEYTTKYGLKKQRSENLSSPISPKGNGGLSTGTLFCPRKVTSKTMNYDSEKHQEQLEGN